MDYQCWILLENKRFLLGVSPYDITARELFEGRQAIQCHLDQLHQFLVSCDRIVGAVSYYCNITQQAWIIVEFQLRGELRIGALKMDASTFRSFVLRYRDGSATPMSMYDYFGYSQMEAPRNWGQPVLPPIRTVKEKTEKANWKREGF